MAEPESKDLTTALASRGQAPVVALVLILATTVGMLNLSPRPGGGSSSAEAAPKGAEPAGFLAGPPPRAETADVLETLEPLLRFLNLGATPGSLDELAGALGGYRITTLIASISDPKDSRLGYDFDMATEAIQRAIESEGYTLDRFRFPWLDPGSPTGTGPSPAGGRTRGRPRRSPPRRPRPPPAVPPVAPPCGARGTSVSPGRSSSGSTGRLPSAGPGPRRRRSSCSSSWSGRRPPGESSRRP